MNPLAQWKIALLLLSALTLTACVLFNRIDEMVASVNGNAVSFSLPAGDLADKDTKYLLSLIDVVARDACAKDCVIWEMVRPRGSNTDLIEENFVKFPIKYGVTLPNMQTRLYRELRKGKYRVGARFAVIKNGKIVDSKKAVATEFTIE